MIQLQAFQDKSKPASFGELGLELALKGLGIGLRLALKGLGLGLDLKDLVKWELFSYREELLLNFRSWIYILETLIVI